MTDRGRVSPTPVQGVVTGPDGGAGGDGAEAVGGAGRAPAVARRVRQGAGVRRGAPRLTLGHGRRALARGRAVWEAVMRDEIGTSASAFAYHTLFALPPLVVLSAIVAALVTRLTSLDVTASLQHQLRLHAPQPLRPLLTAVVAHATRRVDRGGASLGIAATAALALWSGSNAVGSLLRAFNRAYGVAETRSFLQRVRLRLVLTLLLTVAINLAFAAVVFGHRLGRSLADAFHLGARFNRLWDLLTWPTAVVAMALLLAVLYYVGPNVELSFRWLSPGSVLATGLWLGAVVAFGWSLSVANPGSAYGALGSVVVLLLFLDVTGFVFLLGAKVNAEVGKRFDPLTIDDLATAAKTRPGARASARRRLRRWLSTGGVNAPPRNPPAP